jgi:hypothetical protein
MFPAWPKDWSALYKLLARGAFLVSVSIETRPVGFVELESLAGAECRMRNPFEGGGALFRDGRAAEKLPGTLPALPRERGSGSWLWRRIAPPRMNGGKFRWNLKTTRKNGGSRLRLRAA